MKNSFLKLLPKYVEKGKIRDPRIKNWECNMHREELFDANVISAIVEILYPTIPKVVNVN